MTILTVLLLFVATQAAACSESPSDTVCARNDSCYWVAGKCNTFGIEECDSPNYQTWRCRAGCAYTPGVLLDSCAKTDAALCATGTAATCADVGGAGSGTCAMTTGICGPDPDQSCPAELGDGESCPPGCELVRTQFCEVKEDVDCGSYNTVSIGTECGSVQNCSVSESGSCIYNPDWHDFCWDKELATCTQTNGCKLSASGELCEWGGCASLSTEPITECGQHSNTCKISSGSTCVNLTPAESCSTYSVARTTECDLNPNCSNIAGECVGTQYGICQRLSTVPSTECQVKSGAKCKVDSNGACVTATLVCVVDPYKDRNYGACSNPSSDACVAGVKKSCKNTDVATCGRQSTETDCDSAAGCKWTAETADQKCVPTVVCPVSGLCETPIPPGCESISHVDETCTVDPDIDCSIETPSECIAKAGCKWGLGSGSGGGKCVEKPTTCAGDPSYSHCCQGQDASTCPYCSGLTKPSDCVASPACQLTPSYTTCCQQPGPPCTDYCTNANPPDSSCGSVVIPPCQKDPSYGTCCVQLGAECTAYCTSHSTESGCASSGTGTPCGDTPSYATCCPATGGAGCLAFCTTNPSDSDCASSIDAGCISSPTYAKCCPSPSAAGCAGFCAGHPEDAGCKGSDGASHILAPLALIYLLLLLILL